MKFGRGEAVGHEHRIKRGRSPTGEGQSHSNGGRAVPKLRGRTFEGRGFDFSLQENLTDCVNDSEFQGEGHTEEIEMEYEFEYDLERTPKIILDIAGAIKIR